MKKSKLKKKRAHKAIADNAERIERRQHNVSRKAISPSALKVLYRFRDEGYPAYLVGGCIRDLILGHEPKDFDIATAAHPEQIRRLFRNCRLIGRRFRLAHIVYGREIIEVATFRAPPQDEDINDGTGRIVSDNNYGSIEDDVIRRDFTINALYYTIKDFSIVDYVGGMADLEAKKIRLIGDPQQRFAEDPVRALRAARFAAKLGFQLAGSTRRALPSALPLLANIPPARLYEEANKLFLGGYGLASLTELCRFCLLSALFPSTAKRLEDGCISTANLLTETLRNTDKRVADGKSVQPGFIYAAMLWNDVNDEAQTLRSGGMPALQAMQCAGEKMLAQQLKYTALPRRFSVPTQEIWNAQVRLETHTGQRAVRALSAKNFRAAYDFLLLRARADSTLQPIANKWTSLINSEAYTQTDHAPEPEPETRPPRRRRNPRAR